MEHGQDQRHQRQKVRERREVAPHQVNAAIAGVLAGIAGLLSIKEQAADQRGEHRRGLAAGAVQPGAGRTRGK